MANIQHKTTLPPGPRALPVFGNLLDFGRHQLAFVQRMHDTYSDMATIHMGKRPFILLFKPEYVRYLLTENPRNFKTLQSGGDLPEVLGEGLLTIEGEAHRQQRRLVQPAFHKKRVESYADDMVRFTEEMVETWQVDQEIDIAHAMQALTLRIVAKSLFNIELASQVNALGQNFTGMIENRRGVLARILNVYLDAPFTRYGKRMRARRNIDTLIYKLIKERRAEGRDAGDVLSMLLTAQDGEAGLTDVQVRDHVMTLMAAGHETTANALTWTFYQLSQNPAVCKKLLAELQHVLAGRIPSVADMPHLPYTEWVINESMRLYPPVWMMGRRAIEDFEMGDYRFPAGTLFGMSQWVLHRMPELWGDAEAFRPERWDPLEAKKVPQWAYFPFGGGPRICIGMPFAQLEAKLLLTTILQHYTPQLVPGFQVELQPLITLRPRHGLKVILSTSTTRDSEAQVLA
ncbi:MAG: cytochrome P450 [Ktedonobacteraceae bacterium]